MTARHHLQEIGIKLLFTLGEVVEALLDGAVTVEVGVLEAAPDPAVDPAELRGVSGFVKLVPPAVAGLALTGLKF